MAKTKIRNRARRRRVKMEKLYRQTMMPRKTTTAHDDQNTIESARLTVQESLSNNNNTSDIDNNEWINKIYTELLTRYRALLADYDKLGDNYEKLVREYKVLADEIMSKQDNVVHDDDE